MYIFSLILSFSFRSLGVSTVAGAAHPGVIHSPKKGALLIPFILITYIYVYSKHYSKERPTYLFEFRFEVLQ